MDLIKIYKEQHNDFLDRLKDYDDLSDLNSGLNNLYQSLTDGEALFKEIIEKANMSFDDKEITNNLSAVYMDGSAKKIQLDSYWDQVRKANNDIKKYGKESLAGIQAEKDKKEALKRIRGLQNGLNKVRGYAFELFLKASIPFITKEVVDSGSKILNNITESLRSEKNLDLTIAGNDSRIIEYSYKGENYIISSSQKVDVIVPAPILSDNDIANISAKNYSNYQDISLLSGGKLFGLMWQWNKVREVDKNLDNAIDDYINNRNRNELNHLIGAQALAGTTFENNEKGKDKADIMIVLFRNSAKNNRIRAFSTKLMLKKAIQSSAEEFFNIEYSPSFNQTTDFLQYIVNVHLLKSKLSLESLEIL